MPVAVDEIKKVPGRLTVGVFGFEDKNDQVAGGDKILGNLLVAFNDAVGTGRVHHSDVAQDIYGQEDLFQVRIYDHRLLFSPVQDLLHGIGHRLGRHGTDLSV